MRTSSRFTIAIHTLLAIAYFDGKEKTTSNFLAASVGVNPVIIRRTLGQLKDAGLVTVEAGVGGAALAKGADEITLLDVLDAAEPAEAESAVHHSPAGIFGFHEHPNPACPVGGQIHAVLDARLDAAEEAMRASLAQATIADLMDELK